MCFMFCVCPFSPETERVKTMIPLGYACQSFVFLELALVVLKSAVPRPATTASSGKVPEIREGTL